MKELVLNKQYFELKPAGLVIMRKPTFDEWLQAGEVLKYIEGSVHWWLGDWLNYGERAYGEMYSQAVDETTWKYGTLANDKWVAKTFEISRRRENLSWSHHYEVASLNVEEQDKLLDEAEKQRWTRQQLRVAKRKALPLPDLPEGKYNVIYADPPWQYSNSIRSWGPASLHYPTLPLEEICDYRVNGVRVTERFADNAVLFIWVTNPFLQDAFKVIESWGFTYKTNIVWVKRNLRRPGSGFYVRGHHELLFICTKGSFVPDQTGKEPIASVIDADASKHSQKPEMVYEIIETMYPKCRYLELFHRGKIRTGWEAHGYEPTA